MKKLKIVFLIMLSLCVIGCSDKESPKEKVDDSKAVYTFSYNEMDFVLGSEFSREKYGKETSYSEAPSCAFDGVDKTYTYEHYDVTTYPDGDIDRISSIYFQDDEIETLEGVAIGDSLQDMLNAYGNNYEKTENLYTYTLEKTHLNFIVENEIVTSIEYYLDVE